MQFTNFLPIPYKGSSLMKTIFTSDIAKEDVYVHYIMKLWDQIHESL